MSLTGQHATRSLREVESTLLERYRQPLAGDVLELIPGGSRLTDELVLHARSYRGLGPSAAVIGVCRQMHPKGTFVHAEILDLDQFKQTEITAVFAGRCAIDSLDDERRRLLFDRLHRVIAPGGVLLFSSHNLTPAALVAHSARQGRDHPASRLFRRRRASDVNGQQAAELGHAVLGSAVDEYTTLQYHIGRDAQERQLGEAGLQLLECLDLDGQLVRAGETAEDSAELHFAAGPAALAM